MTARRSPTSDVLPRIASVGVQFQAPDVIEAVFRGHVTAEQVEAAIRGVDQRLGERKARFFLLDATDTAGYDVGVREPGVRLLSRLKAGGVEGGACVAPSAAVRMIGAAVAFVASLHIEFHPTREAALEAIARKRARG